MRKKIVFFLIIILLIFYRFIFYSADPFYVSWSTGAYTDIGFYLHNARHQYLFNSPFFGNWDNRFLFPVYHYYYLFLFEIFGLSKLTIQLNLVIIQIIIIFFLYKTIYKIYNDYKISLLAIFVYSYNFNLIRNNRIPFLENMMLLFFIISFFFLNDNKKFSFVLSGVFYVFSIMCKSITLFLLPAYLIFLFLKKKSGIKYFLIGLICVLIIWFLIMFQTNYNILYYTIFNKPIKANFTYLFRIYNVFNTNLFMRMPIIFYSVFFYFLIILLYQIKLSQYQIFLILSFVFSHFFIAFSFYNPDRYYLLLLFFYLLIFVDFIYFIFYKNSEFYKTIKINLIIIFLSFLILHFISYNNIFVFYRSFLNTHILFNNIIKYSFLVILCNLIFFIFFVLLSKKYYHKFIILLLVFSFVLNNYQFYEAIKKRSYAIKEIQDYIAKNIEREKIITGWWAPTLALFSKAKILTVYNEDDYNNFIFDYIILENEIQANTFKNKQIIKIQDFYIPYLKKYITLYQIIK